MTAQTDRELLEAAARAAGVKYDPEKSKPHPKSGAFWGLWLKLDGEPSDLQRRYWNPLRDDGDALRLAVKMKLCLTVRDSDTRAHKYGSNSKRRQHNESQGDPYAATRRAIVRAAAIGAHEEGA